MGLRFGLVEGFSVVWAAKFYICELGIGGLVKGKLLMDLRGRWSVSDMLGNLPSPEVRARAAHLDVTGRNHLSTG